MIKIALCEDLKPVREEIKKKLLNFSFEKNIDFQVDEYSFGEEILDSDVDFDLIIMDYDFGLDKKNGIDVSKEIRRKNHNVCIIFLTSHESVVFDVFEVGAFRFLLKPIDQEKLEKALLDFLSSIDGDSYIKLKIDGHIHVINIKDIVYIEGSGKNCLIHLNKKSEEDLIYKATLSLLEELFLDYEKMYRCHKSFIINFDYVTKYNRESVELADGKLVMLSRRKYNDFCERYTKCLFSRYTNS